MVTFTGHLQCVWGVLLAQEISALFGVPLTARAVVATPLRTQSGRSIPTSRTSGVPDDGDVGDTNITADEVADVIARLQALWEARANRSADFAKRGGVTSVPQMLGVHGLAAHTYRVGGHALVMLDDGLELEAMPMIRLAYECAVTTQWLANATDGANAWLNEAERVKRASGLTLQRAASDVMRAVGDHLLAHGAAPIDTSSDAQARSFEQMCNDLTPGGPELYAYHRLMSRYCHASVHVVDEYLDVTPDGDDVQALRLTAKPADTDTWRYFLALSMLWAARAVDFLDVSRQHRSELRSQSRRLGVTSELHLTPAAQTRMARDERARRVAARRPPRRRAPRGE